MIILLANGLVVAQRSSKPDTEFTTRPDHYSNVVEGIGGTGRLMIVPCYITLKN